MAEESEAFVVKPIRLMVLMSDKGTDAIRKIHFVFSDLECWSFELNGERYIAKEFDSRDLEAMLEAERENGLAHTILQGDVKYLPNDRVKRLFHKLWSQAVGSKDYVKQEWQELSGILRERGYKV